MLFEPRLNLQNGFHFVGGMSKGFATHVSVSIPIVSEFDHRSVVRVGRRAQKRQRKSPLIVLPTTHELEA